MFDQSTLDVRLPAQTPGSWPELKAAVTDLFWTIFVLVAVGTWSVFWGLVIRLHLLQKAYLSAGIVGLLFIAPAIVGISADLGLLPDPQRLAPA